MSIAPVPAVPEAVTAQGPDLTRYFLVCAGVLLLVVVLAWLFRRFVAESMRRRAAKRSLSVTDVLPLGGRQKLIVVRCYDRSFLLGLGDKEITSVAELDCEETVAPARPDPARPDAEPGPSEPFPVRLAQALREPQLEPDRERARDRRRLAGWRSGEGVLG